MMKQLPFFNKDGDSRFSDPLRRGGAKKRIADLKLQAKTFYLARAGVSFGRKYNCGYLVIPHGHL
jgi:hypothetical protein